MKISEADIQKSIIQWSKYHPILRDHLIAIPNGGYRNLSEARSLKSQGVKAGVSDLFLAYPVENFRSDIEYCGLWLELKSEKGKLSAKQSKWIETMRLVGYKCAVARSFEEAKQIIEEYLR